MAAVKGLDVLVESFARLAPRMPRLHLYLVGDGPMRGAVRAESYRLGLDGRLLLLGRRSDVADLAVAPLQDVLNLGTEARMNLPGQRSGWWRWRFTEKQLTGATLDRLGDLTEVYGR